MRPQAIFDLDELDLNFDQPLYGIDEIRAVNPQRFEMEQLTGVVHVDEEGQRLIGFKEITEDEFWIRGHMPGFPLMPGVIMCECAAQLGGFYARKFDLLKGDFLGFGGMDNVKFRAPVQIGDRLVLMARVASVRAGGRRIEFEFQGYVDGQLTFSGTTIGVPIQKG
ncbi:MAG: beta-hydroxyacyl-ACP dehydratase [Planctomycetota bacterium]|nr:beta-hydroxyacyl-ACP dehydratase [Planctomycetota bacterium]MDA1250191.1 beta-hydroxyacyl-ACP dehydratase [Planctomycetota bacterium]